MWLVTHHLPFPGDDARAVPASAAAALRAAHAGAGDQRAEALRLVRDARAYHFWIACDCRAGEGVYPLMTPAYLSTAKVYYLRNLTGEGRAAHADICAFRFVRPEQGLGPIASTQAMLAPPGGLFSLLTSDHGARLAERGGAMRRTSGADAPPRLARLLWRLMLAARLNRLAPVQHAPKPSIRTEFERLRVAAETLDVAPAIALARVLATHAKDYHAERLFARIRAAFKDRSSDEPLQGFLLLYAEDVRANAIIVPGEEPVLIAGELARPRLGEARAPYLVLAVIGAHAQAGGLAALRAYAQPIHSGAQFVPVAGDFERGVLRAINAARWSLQKSHAALEISVEKPLFDRETPDGPRRPAFVVEVLDGDTGEVRTCIIEAVASAEDRAQTAAMPSELVMEVTVSDVADARRLGERLARFFCGAHSR